MFNNRINGEKGRVAMKLLATVLVITLTFANFALIGTYMLESIAIESTLGEQNASTNNENVKFNVYLDQNNINAREVSKDINAEDLNLYVSVSVTGNGKLEKGVIDFSESNFKAKENDQILKMDLKTISSQNGTTIEIPIVARKDERFNLSLLNMISKIKLTGEYVDENGNVTNIDSSKEVKINWTTKEVNQEEVEVTQEIVTNGIYKIDGQNKRILQVLVKTKLKDNKLPVQGTKIEIISSILEKAEEVKVVAYSTGATNGNSSIEFNNQQQSSWRYDEENEIIEVELTNEADEENKISWKKEVADEILVTYVYSEETEIKEIVSNVNVEIKVYGKEEVVGKENTISVEEIEEVGNIIDIKTGITEIYKGKMYLGEETEYGTKNEIVVLYPTGDKIIVENSEDILDTENVITYYKTTKINKEQAKSVLGKEGTIKIYNGENVLKEIKLEEENEEENYVVNYPEGIKEINIETSKAIYGGEIEIINEKAIKVEKVEKIEEATKMDLATKVYVKDTEGNTVTETTKTGSVSLLEPETKIDVAIDKETISNQVENEITITATLKTENNSDKLFNNPTIEIELPEEITEATIMQDIALLYEDELKIKSGEIKTKENGRKVIVVALEGTQTKYDTSANIVMYLKVKANEFMPDKEVEIKTTCINGEEKVEKTNKIKIVSKKGIVTKNSIQVEENKVETINNNVTTTITEKSEIKIKSELINNNGEKINNVVLMGKISEGTNLKAALTTKIDNASISYEVNGNWENNVEDYTQVKAFKIEIQELEQAKGIEIEYVLNPIEEKLGEKDSFESEINLSYAEETQTVTDKILYTVINNTKELGERIESEKISVNVEVTAGGKELSKDEEILNGQVLRYKVKVANNTSEDINNIKINANIENAVFYDLVECGTIYDITEDENGNLLYPDGRTVYTYDEYSKDIKEREIQSIEQLNAGEEVYIQYMIVAYRENYSEESIFSNNIIITAEEMDNIQVAEQRNINDGSIALKVKYGGSEDTKTYSNSDTDIVLEAKNLTNEDLENVTIKMDIPEEMDFNAFDQIYASFRDDISISKENNQIIVTFEKILANKKDSIEITLLTGDIPYNEFNKEIRLIATANVGVDKKTYYSNDYIINLLQSKTCIDAKINSNMEGKELKNNDEIEYTVTIKNNGYLLDIGNLMITDYVQEELDVTSIKVIYSNGTEKDLTATEGTRVITLNEQLNIQESIIIKINARVNLENSDAKEIKNKIYIKSTEIEDVETEILVNKIYKKNPENQDIDENSSTYSISGLAWVDLNENGIIEKNEKVLKGVKVVLLDSEGKIVLKENREQIETNTTLTGTYKFSNLKKGKYMIAFVYDVNKYSVTKYQVEKTEDNNNSDVIAKEIEINGKIENVGITDIIELTDKDITNINIGLIENIKFDLKLDKYISKVVVINKEGTTTYTYENENFTKIEIPQKQIDSSVVLVEYEIKVTNEGNIEGYATDIIDYVSNELTFNSEINPEWYEGTDGSWHNTTLAQEVIEVGKSKSVKLVLTKTLKTDELGTIENIAEIGESTNIQGMEDKDSVEANKKHGEDDMAKAELIISIETGGTIIYISIIFISLLIIGLGIYVIKKKVLEV